MANAQSPQIFSSLPLELREQIYDCILGPENCYIYSQQPYLRNGSLYPNYYATLSINRETRTDAGLYLFRTRYICITLTPARENLKRFLDWFPRVSGYMNIKLHVLKFDENAETADSNEASKTTLSPNMHFILQRPNLRDLKLMVRYTKLLPEAADQVLERVYPTAQDVITRYDSNRLLEMPRLKKIMIYWTCQYAQDGEDWNFVDWGIYIGAASHVAPWRVFLREVVKRLQANFKTHGRDWGMPIRKVPT